MNSFDLVRETVCRSVIEVYESAPENEQLTIAANLFTVLGLGGIGLYTTQDGFDRIYNMVYGETSQHAIIRDFLSTLTARFTAHIQTNALSDSNFPQIHQIANVTASSLYSFGGSLPEIKDSFKKVEVPYETPPILLQTTLEREETLALMDKFPWYMTICVIFVYADFKTVLSNITKNDRAARPPKPILPSGS